MTTKEPIPNLGVIPPNMIETNVNSFEGDLLLTCTYSPQTSPKHFKELSKGRRSFSFCPELIHPDKLGFKLCTIFRLNRVTSITILTKDGSPHSMQIPLMVQEAAEDTGFDKNKIRYFCLEGGELFEISDLTVRKARHYSAVEKLMPYAHLEKITAILRSENGCPNDKSETFNNIVEHLREEIEEVAAAIERNDLENLTEEIGDIVFNLFLFAQIGKEQNEFDMNTIISKLGEKMIRRHPSVFNGLKYKY